MGKCLPLVGHAISGKRTAVRQQLLWLDVLLNILFAATYDAQCLSLSHAVKSCVGLVVVAAGAFVLCLEKVWGSFPFSMNLVLLCHSCGNCNFVAPVDTVHAAAYAKWG